MSSVESQGGTCGSHAPDLYRPEAIGPHRRVTDYYADPEADQSGASLRSGSNS